MPDYTFIVNVGLARCGTTAASKFMSDHPAFATPTTRKELKYFFTEPVSVKDYVAQFSGPGPRFFEASPPYARLGDNFPDCLGRIARLRDAGHRVVILFCLRNLIKRAFSLYWHDIGSHHARYGATWNFRQDDDPNRFTKLYTRGFTEQMKAPETREKFMPDVTMLIAEAAKVFGQDAVRIAYMKRLDQSLQELMEMVGIAVDAPVKSKRIAPSSAPLYLNGGLNGHMMDIETKTGPRRVTVPGGTCLLFSRRHAEVLRADRFDIEAITAAAKTWSYDVSRDALPGKLVSYAKRQAAALSKVPSEMVLAGAKKEMMADLRTTPEVLGIEPIRPLWSEVQRLLDTART